MKSRPSWYCRNGADHYRSGLNSSSVAPHPLRSLAGVGPRIIVKLEKMGISRPQDLLFHLPFRYQDKTRVTRIADLQNGHESVIFGQIHSVDVRFGRRRSLLVRVNDSSASIFLRFFHFSHNQQKGFCEGAWIQCYGEARCGYQGLEMVHPEYKIFNQPGQPALEKTLTPVYPATEGLGQKTIRRLVSTSLANYRRQLSDMIPPELQVEFGLMSLTKALQTVHNPPVDCDADALKAGIHPACQRLALEELLAHQLAFHRLRQKRQRENGPLITDAGKSWSLLKDRLDFELTGAQIRVIKEIQEDLCRKYPVMRLVQGDVGSGKTIVCAAAALQAIDSGYQAALMAPTELLAEQHRKTFYQWLEPLNIDMEWLTGKLTAANRRKALSRIAGGEAKMVIGTHALFQESVEFNKLGLIIVDEQHRFGVDQRLAMRGKGTFRDTAPHQIVMSATPIPRSLAMILYADLDISNIDELPAGRKPVTTVALPDTRRREVADRIRSNCRNGLQAYWVCPLIEESDKLQIQTATETCAALRALLPELRIELIHGRLKSKEKESIMHRFDQGLIDLLVATTVIEVGVDVPNANLMIIENAERLGLAQLHQLRGRVGRSADQASCVLLYQAPLGAIAKERLGILRSANDGFEIARKDLEQRGPGELLGTRQTGIQQMRIANIVRDRAMIPRVELISRKLREQHPHRAGALISRWIHNSEQYADV